MRPISVMPSPVIAALPLIDCMCQPSEIVWINHLAHSPAKDEAHRGEIDPCFTRFGILLVVLTQSPVAAEPPDRAFHHPPPGEHLKADLVGRLVHDHQPPAA